MLRSLAQGRFTIQRPLGEGGFGAVYEAYDHEREARVALKVLKHVDAAGLYQFKQEFRALCDVVHPNLVTLHELIAAGARWFFTMELIEGVDLFTFLRGDASPPPSSSRYADTLTSSPAMAFSPTVNAAPSEALQESVASPPSAEPPRLSFPLVRDTFRKLAEGLLAVHAAGKLHRDLKPSNVLVTPLGRVVILDFGLIEAIEAASTGSTLMGTPAYMAPEQVTGAPLSPASDWYAFGTMLYEVLTGSVPFSGTTTQIAIQKCWVVPPPAIKLNPVVPADLNELCVGLLAIRPEARPRGHDVIKVLDAAASEAEERATRGDRKVPGSPPFLGRAKQLSMLSEAFALTKEGRAAMVHVRGLSGMGKTSLIRHFINNVGKGDGALIFEGRCYERESVPYKAVDSLIDELSRYLCRLPEASAAELIPRGARELARLFPVLDQVPGFAQAAPTSAFLSDARELRSRGFVALRELFASIRQRGPVVLYIDDLQWGDADSAALLAELLRPPDAPPLLLLVSYRSEDASKSELLQRLPAVVASNTRDKSSNTIIYEVLLGPLENEEALELARSLLGGHPAPALHEQAIVSEAGGSPFFVAELARAVVTMGPQAAPYPGAQARAFLTMAPQAAPYPGAFVTMGGDSVRLETVLAERFGRLTPEARALLEIVAVAGQPIRRGAARLAAELGAEQEQAALAVLRADHLLRTRGRREALELETFHDRIREAAVAQLNRAELARRHLRIATVLESSEGAEPDVLAMHFGRANERDKAAMYNAVAADRAAQALAFDHAAELYRRALELGQFTREERSKLSEKLASALANAGRCVEAARAYLDASRDAPSPAISLEQKRLSAENFLRSGYVDEGMAVLRDSFAAIGESVPETPARSLASLLVRRAELRLRGLHFKERAEADIPQDVLTRMDLFWSAALGLGMVHTIRAAYFQIRNLLLALSAGEPRRIACALAMEAGFVGSEGRNPERMAELLEQAGAIAQRSAHPYSLAMVQGLTGTTRFFEGRFRESNEALAQAAAILRERCTGVSWENGSLLTFELWNLWLLGRARELSRRVPAALAAAEERGDKYLATNLRSGFTNAAWLVEGNPGRALREAEDALSGWSKAGFQIQHFYDLVARTHIDLYQGDAGAAHHRLAHRWTDLKRSLSLHVGWMRIFMTDLRARAALAAAARERSFFRREELLFIARRDARSLEAERVLWARPFAAMARAGLAALRGDTEGAALLLRRAFVLFDALGMALFAAAARRRYGELLGGEEGRALVAASKSWMTEQGIADPDRMTAVLSLTLPLRF